MISLSHLCHFRAGQRQPDNREQVQQGGEEEACMAVLNNFYGDGECWPGFLALVPGNAGSLTRDISDNHCSHLVALHALVTYHRAASPAAAAPGWAVSIKVKSRSRFLLISSMTLGGTAPRHHCSAAGSRSRRAVIESSRNFHNIQRRHSPG